MTRHIAIALAVLAASSATAAADTPGVHTPSMATAAPIDVPRERRMTFFGGGASARVLGIDGASEAYLDTLDAYGYDNVGHVVMGLYAFGGYRGLRVADVGLVGEYSYIQHAQPADATISMRTHAKQLGVFARPRLTGLGAAADLGVRLELGAVRSSTTLRQESMVETSPYVRAELDLMLGGDRMGAHLHAGYTQVLSGDNFAPHLAPALGGLSFGVGIYRRY